VCTGPPGVVRARLTSSAALLSPRQLPEARGGVPVQMSVRLRYRSDPNLESIQT